MAILTKGVHAYPLLGPRHVPGGRQLRVRRGLLGARLFQARVRRAVRSPRVRPSIKAGVRAAASPQGHNIVR